MADETVIRTSKDVLEVLQAGIDDAGDMVKEFGALSSINVSAEWLLNACVLAHAEITRLRPGNETLPGHDLRVMCPAEVDVKAIDKALGPGWVHRLATGLQSSRAPRQRPERESDALLAAAMLTGEMGSDTPKASEPPMFRHDWQMLPGGSYQCLRCGTQCLDAHDAKLCPVNAKSEVEQHG